LRVYGHEDTLRDFKGKVKYVKEGLETTIDQIRARYGHEDFDYHTANINLHVLLECVVVMMQNYLILYHEDHR